MNLALILSLDINEILETNVVNIVLLVGLLIFAGRGTLISNLKIRRAQIYNNFQDIELRLNESQSRLESCQATWLQAEILIYNCLAERTELEQRFFINKTKKFLTKIINFIERFRLSTIYQGNLCSELIKRDLLEFLSWCIDDEISLLLNTKQFETLHRLMLIRKILQMRQQTTSVIKRVKSVETK